MAAVPFRAYLPAPTWRPPWTLQRGYLLQHSPLHGLEGNTCLWSLPKPPWAADEYLLWHLEHLLTLLLGLWRSQDSHTFPHLPSILTVSAVFALLKMCFHGGIARFSYPTVGWLPSQLCLAQGQPLGPFPQRPPMQPPGYQNIATHTQWSSEQLQYQL